MTKLTSLVFRLVLPLLAFISTASAQAVNRTFTLTAFGTTNPAILNQPVLIRPPTGPADVVVGTGFPAAETTPLVAYIFNGNIYRPCTTSPTGACIGFLTKAYGGALTGWYFDFSEDDQPRTYGPGAPLLGRFAVETDNTPWPAGLCRPTVDVLNSGSSQFWTLCEYFGPGTYEVNSSPIPSTAVNGPRCQTSGVKFRVKYT